MEEKESWNFNDKQRRFIEWTNGVWTFSGESRKKIGHPAPFHLNFRRDVYAFQL